MLEPAYIAGLSDEFIELYAQVERDITADVARRIAKTGYMTSTAKWQLERGRQIGLFQKDVEKVLSEATGLSKPAIRKLMSEAGYKALAADDKVYALAGLDKIDFTKSDTMKSILLQGTDTTYQLMKNFTKTTAKTASKALEHSLDRAYLQTMSGAFTREQAIKNAVNDLAKQGITKIAYPNGSSVSVEAGVRRAVTTGINQTCAKLQIARANELGSDLVEVSSHSGARPSHAVWQGQIYSLSGKHPRYGDFYEVTEYGSGGGLCGWNCYHNFFPFIEGVSTPAFEKDQSASSGKSNDQVYDESQKQRYYERQVRDAKRRSAAYQGAAEAAQTPEEKADFEAKVKEANKLVRNRQKSLREYCKATGRDQEYSRTYIVGYNKPYTIGSK